MATDRLMYSAVHMPDGVVASVTVGVPLSRPENRVYFPYVRFCGGTLRLLPGYGRLCGRPRERLPRFVRSGEPATRSRRNRERELAMQDGGSPQSCGRVEGKPSEGLPSPGFECDEGGDEDSDDREGFEAPVYAGLQADGDSPLPPWRRTATARTSTATATAILSAGTFIGPSLRVLTPGIPLLRPMIRDRIRSNPGAVKGREAVT
jgi:hypothetical protein